MDDIHITAKHLHVYNLLCDAQVYHLNHVCYSMAPIWFSVIEHVIPGQHIREYPNATKLREEDVLQISIKQYVPLNRSTPAPDNAVTIIGAHSNGFPKVGNSCNPSYEAEEISPTTVQEN
ncbi:MAG: hypothetical protein Q9191_005875 [Dirinaria sp. TL-2023a]